MEEELIAFYLLSSLVALMIGADKGGVGGMLSTLGVPIMSVIMPVNQAIAIVLPMLMVGDIFAVHAHWKHWEGSLLPKLLPGSVAGVFLGTFVLINVPSGALRVTLGILIMLFIAYRLVERRIIGQLVYQAQSWHGVLGGLAAGLTSTIAHAGGPPITIYLLLQRLEPRTFVSTAAIFFATLNVFKLPFYAAAGLFEASRLLAIVWFLPVVPVGVWLGKQLAVRIPKVVFERIVLFLLLVAAALLLFGN